MFTVYIYIFIYLFIYLFIFIVCLLIFICITIYIYMYVCILVVCYISVYMSLYIYIQYDVHKLLQLLNLNMCGLLKSRTALCMSMPLQNGLSSSPTTNLSSQ